MAPKDPQGKTRDEQWQGESFSNHHHEKNATTVYACKCEAHEATRKCIPKTQKDHEDHLTEKGINSMSHHNLVHKPIPFPQATKIPDAKAAIDKNGIRARIKG